MKNRTIILITILMTIITFLFLVFISEPKNLHDDMVDRIWRMLSGIFIFLSNLITIFSLIIIKEIRKLNNNK